MGLKRDDSVEQAFSLLRGEQLEARPDEGLEARLRARHRRLERTGILGRLSLVIGALGLSAALAAAADAPRWVRERWFVVSVDGQVLQGSLQAGESKLLPYARQDGSQGLIQLHQSLDVQGNQRTEIGIAQARGGSVEEQRLVHQSGQAAWQARPVEALVGATLLHSGVDVEVGAVELYALADPAGGSRLLFRLEEGREPQVRELGRLALGPRALEASLDCSHPPGGGILIRFSAGEDEESELFWRVGASAEVLGVEPQPQELQTADGSVRVRLHGPMHP